MIIIALVLLFFVSDVNAGMDFSMLGDKAMLRESEITAQTLFKIGGKETMKLAYHYQKSKKLIQELKICLEIIEGHFKATSGWTEDDDNYIEAYLIALNRHNVGADFYVGSEPCLKNSH